MYKVNILGVKSFFMCMNLVVLALCWNCKGFHFNLKLISCSGEEEGGRYSVRNKRSLLSPSCAPGICSQSSGESGSGKFCADRKRKDSKRSQMFFPPNESSSLTLLGSYSRSRGLLI